jgi:hypothetical protein
MNTHEFEDRLEALWKRRGQVSSLLRALRIGGLLAELRLRPNIGEAVLVINLLQTPVCVFRSKLEGYSAFRPFMGPADLSLSGGYVGAKRMLWLNAHGANTVKENEHAQP